MLIEYLGTPEILILIVVKNYFSYAFPANRMQQFRTEFYAVYTSESDLDWMRQFRLVPDMRIDRSAS